jgi:hypothetical protein
VFCQHCGNAITEGQLFCQQCGSRLAAEGGPGIPDGGRRKTPWEDREGNGYLSGLFMTVKDVLLNPSDFFKKMAVTGGLTGPLLFAMIIGMVGLLFISLWDLVLHDSMQSFMTPEMMGAAGRGMPNAIASPFSMVMMPFMLVLWLFIVSGMLHFFLMVVRGANAGFEATFRVISYSVSPFLFMVIPYCGTMIAMLWMLTLTIIGLRDAHRISGGKATAAVLLPFLMCCGMMALAVVLFMGTLASQFGSMMHLYK